MTRDDIIKLAREAGTQHVGPAGLFVPDSFSLRFAALVAAAEREECAKMFDGEHDAYIALAIRARGET